MENVWAWSVIRPEHFAGKAVQADKARCLFLRDGDVSVVDTIGGVHKEKIAHAGDRATAHVML